jgi:hypothetical protein
MIFFYGIGIFMIESERKNKNLNFKIHIQIERRTKILLKNNKRLICYQKLFSFQKFLCLIDLLDLGFIFWIGLYCHGDFISSIWNCSLGPLCCSQASKNSKIPLILDLEWLGSYVPKCIYRLILKITFRN